MTKTFPFLVAVFVFISCAKDDIAPIITSLNLEMNDTIRNIYTIELEATDNEKINKIELFINDSLVAEDSRMPFLFEWNTLKAIDGNHSIRLTVTDPEGNKAESNTEVYVNNNLLILNAGAIGYYPNYLIVSDEQGNVLDTANLKRFTKTVLKPQRPFEGNAVNLIWIEKIAGYSQRTEMSAYVHVKRGSEYKLIVFPEPESFKYVKIHFKNDIPYFSGIRIVTDQYFYELRSMSDTINVLQEFPYTAGHKLLIQLFTNEGRFYRFYDIDNIPEITINLSDITATMAQKVITFPAEGGSYSIYGKGRDKDSRYGYFISYQSPNLLHGGNNLELWYPAEYFVKYQTWLSYMKPGRNAVYTDIYNVTLPSVYNLPDGDVQIQDPSAANFSATLSGKMDFYTVIYKNEDRSNALRITAPAGYSAWKLPDPGPLFNDDDLGFTSYSPEEIDIEEFESIEFRDKYYDLTIDFKKLHNEEPHLQTIGIGLW